ncbi:HPF/RaiA family ribosome-associated protein [Pseudonocardia sp. H11422]|uniref:HPF/RaiA family ribosome-associated protein n=1 Tax=Pseudonocardia sp. H11422 TaxID=2835866 RepID=UPI0027E24DC1|nr:HPF/RaiA family ribosome-associated protein [Pseudonocardia sp. H11422]
MRQEREHVTAPEIVVQLEGGVQPDLADYARGKVAAALHHGRQPALHVRVRIVRHGDPAREQPVTAQVNIDLNGRLVRVQTSASTPREAVDRLVARLQHRLERVRWTGRPGGAGYTTGTHTSGSTTHHPRSASPTSPGRPRGGRSSGTRVSARPAAPSMRPSPT